MWSTQEPEAVFPEEDELEIIDAAAKGERELERDQICDFPRAKNGTPVFLYVLFKNKIGMDLQVLFYCVYA